MGAPCHFISIKIYDGILDPDLFNSGTNSTRTNIGGGGEVTKPMSRDAIRNKFLDQAHV